MKLQENIERIKEMMGLISEQTSNISCTENGCNGTYIGPEFNEMGDIAHKFSNTMSGKVGDKLKELYRQGKYKKVDLNNIRMSTDGMGSGNVTYKLFIPFIDVQNNCDAYTSFEHVGGWNHTPELNRRISELSGVLLPGDEFDISNLKRTKEGLQEYWIQWRNKQVQADCAG